MLVVRLVLRDLATAWAGAGLVLPVAFFLIVATLYPFAVGPDATLLARTGGAILWVAALLAALLPIDRLITPDLEAGVIDQLILAGLAEEVIILAKLIAHWLGFGPALLLAAVPAAGLLGIDPAVLVRVELGLLIGTPGLAALGLMVAALTAGMRGGGAALTGILMLPLGVPLLIFGAGSLAPTPGAALGLLGAVSLVLVAIAPFAGGAALRAAQT